MTSLQNWLTEAGEATPSISDDLEAQLVRFFRDLGGVMVAGTRAPTVARLHEHLERTAAHGSVPLLGTDANLDPINAALANSTAAQALDFDDIAPSCVSHLGAVIVPAVMSIVDDCGPERAFEGVVLGLSVVDRLAEAFTHEVYDRGLQPTHTMGSIAATLALLHGLEATPEERHAALGLLATQMIGLRAHTGTSYKPVQAGVVSSAAVRTVMMARAGIRAGSDAIDVVMRLLGIDDDQLEALTRPGDLRPVPLAAKAYPTCGASHTTIEATQRVRAAIGIDDDEALDVDISIRVPPRVMDALAFDRPDNPDQARFSMHYPVATAWVTGEVQPTDFTTDAVARDEVRRVMDRVVVQLDDRLTPPPTWSGFPAVVTAEVGDRTETVRVEQPLGYPERPFTDDQWEAKFRSCVTPVLGEDRAASAFERLTHPHVLARLGEALRHPSGSD